ncbi:DUF1641 domain-containing protein [Brevibacillus antibioticus]|uniref:DUF1641 domain-containing protein n=1 Tax=Brevibacillus antibioticus TaxID=2570228 RepID=A0A4U2Y6T8_9BACL|nr:DUF1641 domain-containing protein [Brevibacillus antibioticus]TKI55522.1 DUF1641 domain-containing protein [Brevibacillus antibioticus]
MNDRQEQRMFLEDLSDPEVQEAITILIRKLPKIKDTVLAAEEGLEVATSILRDQESLRYLFERVDGQLSRFFVEKESIDALFTLLDKLPKLVKYVSVLEQVADFLESIGKDKQSQQYLLNSMKAYIAPVSAQVEHGVAVFQEAKARAERKNEPVSVFTLYKLMKDPTVQKSLRFTQSLLEVLAEKSNK